MIKNETYYFIVNGNAGVGRKKSIWKHVLKPELIRRGVHFHQYECSYPGHGTKIASQIMAEHTGQLMLIVVGGDGTFNEVLNGITDFERVTVSYIPAGSANDLGYALGISSDPLRALTQILDGGRIYRMDIGKTTFHREPLFCHQLGDRTGCGGLQTFRQRQTEGAAESHSSRQNDLYAQHGPPCSCISGH